MSEQPPPTIPFVGSEAQGLELSNLEQTSNTVAAPSQADMSAAEKPAAPQMAADAPSIGLEGNTLQGTPNTARDGEASPQSQAGQETNTRPTDSSHVAPTLDASAPAVLITLLLPSTGTRHPFRIDGPYLKKHNVHGSTPANQTLAQAVDGAADSAAGIVASEQPEEHEETNLDPWAISVYTLKELIWRDWKDEWDARPTSPSAIRLIHFGRMLDDKNALKDLRLNATITNMVHMTVKPADLDDDDAGGKLGKITSRSSAFRSRRRDNVTANVNNDAGTNFAPETTERSSPGCRCSIM